MNNNNNNNNKAIIPEIMLSLLVFAILVVIVFLCSGNITTVSNEGDLNNKISALVCKLSQNIDGPFYFSDATKVNHEIRMILDDQGINSFYYIYEGTFSSDERAKNAIVAVHADYDIDLGKNNNSDKPEAHFSYVDRVGRISINARIKEINNIVGKYLLLEDIISNNIKARSKGEIKTYYESLGFSCKYN